jgi:hypothetical protein
MSITAEPIAQSTECENFAMTEYESISHTFASGLNAMAVLLPLFFIFTGGVLNYVGGLFNDLAKPDTYRVEYFNVDFRIWQIYLIAAIGFVFTVWSLGFVLVFRDGAGRMLKRASEIEALYPDVSARHESRLFMLLNDWYSGDKGFSALRLLFWSTVAFYGFIFISYALIMGSALGFNRY